MFHRLARFVVHNPWPVIGAWLIAAIAIVLSAPSLNDVITRDQAEFLPTSYESVQAQKLAQQAFSQRSDESSITVVVKRGDGQPLSDKDQAAIGKLSETINSAHSDRVIQAVTGQQALSPNKKVQLVTVAINGFVDDKKVLDAVERVRNIVKPEIEKASLDYAVTGEAALALDNQDAFKKALAIIGIATITLIIVLLLIIYRSPIAALLPIVTIGVVSAISPGIIAWIAKAFDLQVDPSLEIILTIVLFGVGTDYIVFLLFRYREQLRAGEDRKAALISAVRRVSEVITSAAGAIVVAFSVLLLAVFGGFKSLGPGLAIAVAIMAFAALTLVPAVVSLLGTKVFWPSKAWQRTPKGSTFQRLGALTARKPALVACVSGGLMVVLALGVFGLNYDYDQFSQLPSTTESARGVKDLQSGFPAGALNPTTVYVRSNNGQPLNSAALEQYAQTLKGVDGVGGVMPTTEGKSAKLNADNKTAQIDLLLSDSPYSNKALDLAGGKLRKVAHAQAPQGCTALVGGLSSTYADIQNANNRDLMVIFPVAGLLIGIILALLLRSLIAPIYLLLTVLLGFFSTLGATVFTFQGIGGRVGLSFSLPTILYLFVVAIGTDYNILMIARLREEAQAGNNPRKAADYAIEHGGPSIGSAGLILAATFASMLLSGVSFLTEIGFSVSVGILLAAFVMSMFLVPSLTALIGHKAWWPGHGDRAKTPSVSFDPEEEPVPQTAHP